MSRRAHPRTIRDLVRAGVLRPVQPTTASGWTRYPRGMREFLPAATNLLKNPRTIDSNSDGQSDYSSGIGMTITGTPIYTVEVSAGPLGGNVQRIQYTGVAGDVGGKRLRYGANYPMDGSAGVSPGDTVTGSFYYSLTTTRQVSATMVWRDSGGALISSVGLTPLTADGAWRRFNLTGVAPAGAAQVGLEVADTGNAVVPGDVIDLRYSSPQAEKSAIATPYFDGSRPDCAWTGTANASTSTRTVSALTVPLSLGSTAWTVAGCYSGLWAHNDSAAHNLLTLYAGADARATVYKHTDNKVYASVTDGTDTATSASAAQTLAANTLNTFVARSTWESTVNLSLNGTASTEGDASAVGAQDITSLVIGGTPTGSVGPLVVSGTDKGATWAAAVQGAMNNPVRLVRDFMAVGDYIFPLSSNATAFVKVS